MQCCTIEINNHHELEWVHRPSTCPQSVSICIMLFTNTCPPPIFERSYAYSAARTTKSGKVALTNFHKLLSGGFPTEFVHAHLQHPLSTTNTHKESWVAK